MATKTPSVVGADEIVVADKIADDPRLAGCQREDCVKAFAAYAEVSGDDIYEWRHCETVDCHELYWHGKNGANCVRCDLKACENCQCTVGGYPSDEDAEDGWYCEDCYPTIRASSPVPVYRTTQLTLPSFE